MGEPCRPTNDRYGCLTHKQELGKCVEALQAEVEALRAVNEALTRYRQVEGGIGTTAFVGWRKVKERWLAVKDAQAALARAKGGGE